MIRSLLSFPVRKIHTSAWLLVVLSAALQIVIFPLPNFYMLGWVALTPLLLALLRARRPDSLQLREAVKLLPARPLQAFVLAYVCGFFWYAGTCYWIYNTMRQYGGVNTPAALGLLTLFCMYLAVYHGVFGLVIGLLAERTLSRRALLLAPMVWVGVELARTRITGFPWDLLGTTQVDNVPLARLATFTGVYGLSFEIMVVNVAVATAFLVRREKRQLLLVAALAAGTVLQCGEFVPTPAVAADHSAVLVQPNIPILEGSAWTKDYFGSTLSDLSSLSLQPPTSSPAPDPTHPDLIAWPESPAPFDASDPLFRDAISTVARRSSAWVVAGSLGTASALTPGSAMRYYNSGSLVNPGGQWVSRYDKIHLVPFGEYVPFRRLFSFAGGLTKEVGDFSRGTSRQPLDAGDEKLGVFICYESIFPDEIRQLVDHGAQVFVNISNDGWYGDSGAYAQHLKQARMRAVENARWLLRDTNTGVTASIDPYGRVVVTAPRKVRVALLAPYALSNLTTFYTRHGDWFAYLCAIISIGALIARCLFRTKAEQTP
jgi:apolipoprotein N-acyltransferase